jgi:hypothetical protein
MAAKAKITKEDFLGAWSLVSQVDHDANGAITHMRGDNPLGLLVYQVNGLMSVQLMRRERRSGVSLNALSTALGEYLGYFGTFIVDEKSATVTHFVLGSSYPDYVNTQQVRGFQFEDDGATLILTSKARSERDLTHVLTWRRE